MTPIVELVEKTAAGLGFELVEFEASPRGRLLRIFIDRADALTPESTVTIDDCTRLSHQLSQLFLVENIDYDRMEVSSPGMDRLLTKPAHYQRYAGFDLRIKLRVPRGVQRNLSGSIIACDENAVRIKTETEEITLPLDHIDRARLVPKF